MDSTNLVEIRDLSIGFGDVTVVQGLDLDIPAGKTLCLVGESGCGKSVTAKALLQVIDHPGRIDAGAIALRHASGDQVDLAALDPRGPAIRAIRGNEIAMIHQEPMSFLSPLYTIGNQIAEALMLHSKISKEAAREASIAVLAEVGMPEPERRVDSYTCELSGGQRQRAMIAMALINRPRLLVADEPTTALDVTTQATILALLARLQRDSGMSVLFITHDLGVVGEIADAVAVMYLGSIVERGPVDVVLGQPKHPYTRGLLAAMPRLDGQFGRPLQAIPGMVPSPAARPPGCAFHSRCAAMRPGICDVEPVALTTTDAARAVACHAYGPHADQFDLDRDLAPAAVASVGPRVAKDAKPLLAIDDLHKHFPIRAGFFERIVGQVRAVDGVSLVVHQGETLGLVGESGCGKSTLGQTLVGLHRASGGHVQFTPPGGAPIDALAARGDAGRQLRRDIRMVFQDPSGSLNPRLRVRDIIGEVLEMDGQLSSAEITARVRDLLVKVGLSPDYDTRYPHAFSGGQRQRIAIARALASNPKLVIADEAVSALDVSVQTQIINLLKDLQAELGLTYIFISHDLGVVANVSDRVCVMFAGRIVETGPTERIFRRPAHPYSESLLAAIPGKRLGLAPAPLVDAGAAAGGCSFQGRCPYAIARCQTEQPALVPLGAGQAAACHRATELNLASPLPQIA